MQSRIERRWADNSCGDRAPPCALSSKRQHSPNSQLSPWFPSGALGVQTPVSLAPAKPKVTS